MDGSKMESPVDLRQTPAYADYMRLIGWQAERVPDWLYIKKIPLLPWSIAKLQRAKNVDWERVKRVIKKYWVIKVITEETIAKKTIWVDLRKSEKQLLAEMKPKTRYNIGLARRKRVRIKVVSGKSILQTGLFNLLKQNASRLRIFGLPQKWFEAQVAAFKNKCFAVLSYVDGELVAGVFYMTSKDACFYSYNGSTEMGRKLMAPSLCVWAGIREAKRRKLKVFDFEGIYDGSRSLRRWKGFTKFKQGFGGKEITFS
jgi:lipid II:glycine glycyltransferase (peptidoglycan interpeptide bridge formation enzyme)